MTQHSIPGGGGAADPQSASTSPLLARQADLDTAGIAAVVRRSAHRLRFTTEAHLQQGLTHLFAEARLSASREQQLSRRDRPDFLIGTVAVEAKVKGSPAEVHRQITRYLTHPHITGVVLVTRCARHRELHGSLCGKPVHVVWSGVIG